MHQYHKELQEWHEEKARQEVEFTITDKKVKVRRAERASHSRTPPASAEETEVTGWAGPPWKLAGPPQEMRFSSLDSG